MSIRVAEKLAAGESVCPQCNHWLSDHHLLDPMSDPRTLACTEHYRDPFGPESFCDCVIDLEGNPDA